MQMCTEACKWGCCAMSTMARERGPIDDIVSTHTLHPTVESQDCDDMGRGCPICALHTMMASCGVATISRLLKIMGLFCRISSLLYGSFANETYNFKEPTTRSHFLSETQWQQNGWRACREGAVRSELQQGRRRVIRNATIPTFSFQ